MEKKEEPIHQPEFIILDGNAEPESQSSQREYFEALNRLESKHYPLSLRFMLLLAAIAVIFVVLFYILASVMAWLVACLTFFSLETQVDHLHKTWKACKRLTVVALGLVVAIFSPAFGLGMMLLYFLMHGENINEGIIGRVFRSGIHPI
jgi:hypothetical protein